MGAKLSFKLVLDCGSSLIGMREPESAIQRPNTPNVSAMHRVIDAESDRDAIAPVPHILHQHGPFRERFTRFRRLAIDAIDVKVIDAPVAPMRSAQGINPLIQDNGQFQTKLALVIFALTPARPPCR
jgi:hypothetical protein